MKSRFLMLGFVMAMWVFTGCASSHSQLIGAWAMLDDRGEPTEKIKILSEDRFAFGALIQGEVWAGGGTWQLVDDVYFETIGYHVHQNLIGRKLRFDCRIVDGLWYHEGQFEAGGRNYQITEVWQKLDD
jgi:hypothetical protein